MSQLRSESALKFIGNGKSFAIIALQLEFPPRSAQASEHDDDQLNKFINKQYCVLSIATAKWRINGPLGCYRELIERK